MERWSRFDKTRAVLIVLSIIVLGIVFLTQIYGKSSITTACSYLDPIYIDIFAFLAGLFLVVEGGISIYKNKAFALKKQWGRILRIILGFSILTLHTMQFIHK
jgi:uncharacterized membrane protein SirB2